LRVERNVIELPNSYSVQGYLNDKMSRSELVGLTALFIGHWAKYLEQTRQISSAYSGLRCLGGQDLSSHRIGSHWSCCSI
jgi:hypothetical protein